MAAFCLVARLILLVRRYGFLARRLAFVIRIRRRGCMLRGGRRPATRLLRRHRWSLIRSARRLGCHYTLTLEFARLASGRNRGPSVVFGCEGLFFVAGPVFVPRFRGQRVPVVLLPRP